MWGGGPGLLKDDLRPEVKEICEGLEGEGREGWKRYPGPRTQLGGWIEWAQAKGKLRIDRIPFCVPVTLAA